MSPLGLILVVILIVALLGGFSGRFGGYGYATVMAASASDEDESKRRHGVLLPGVVPPKFGAFMATRPTAHRAGCCSAAPLT